MRTPWLSQAVDPIISPLLQYGAVGTIAALAITGVIVLWRREARALDLERELNTQLRAEIKELNTVLRDYLLTVPRTSSTITDAVHVFRTIP